MKYLGNNTQNEQGTLSRLSSKCRRCIYVKTCNHKQMEALAYLKSAASDVSQPLVQPLLRKKDLRDIYLDKHTTVTIDLEELKEQMKKDFYKNLIKNGA